MKLDGIHDPGGDAQGFLDFDLVRYRSRLRSPTPIAVSDLPVSHVPDALTYRFHRLKHRIQTELRSQTWLIQFDDIAEPMEAQVLVLPHASPVGHLTELQQDIAYQRLFYFVEQDISESVEQLDPILRSE